MRSRKQQCQQICFVCLKGPVRVARAYLPLIEFVWNIQTNYAMEIRSNHGFFLKQNSSWEGASSKAEWAKRQTLTISWYRAFKTPIRFQRLTCMLYDEPRCTSLYQKCRSMVQREVLRNQNKIGDSDTWFHHLKVLTKQIILNWAWFPSFSREKLWWTMLKIYGDLQKRSRVFNEGRTQNCREGTSIFL